MENGKTLRDHYPLYEKSCNYRVWFNWRKALQIIKNIKYFDQIYVFSRRRSNKKFFISSWNQLNKIDPDYFIISNESNLHLKTFNLINNKFKKKNIY